MNKKEKYLKGKTVEFFFFGFIKDMISYIVTGEPFKMIGHIYIYTTHSSTDIAKIHYLDCNFKIKKIVSGRMCVLCVFTNVPFSVDRKQYFIERKMLVYNQNIQNSCTKVWKKKCVNVDYIIHHTNQKIFSLFLVYHHSLIWGWYSRSPITHTESK